MASHTDTAGHRTAKVKPASWPSQDWSEGAVPKVANVSAGGMLPGLFFIQFPL